MVVAIIQARMGSTRLPEKVLGLLGDKPLIHHVFARLAPSKKVNKFVLATTTDPKDDLLEKWARENKIDYYRGSINDVLDRYYQAALKYSPDIVVRITADDPFKDYRMLDQMIDRLQKENLDFISNNNPPTFPEGLDLEVMKFSALEKSAKSAKDPFEREHVTQFVYRNPSQFKIANHTNAAGNLSALRWTIDTQADMTMAKKVYEELYSANTLFQYEQILSLLERKPEIKDINQNQKRSAMYLNKGNESMERFTELEKKYVLEVLDNSFRNSKNSIFNSRLEKKFAETFKQNFAIGIMNGTCTMHAALHALGVKPGDEVIVPPLTMSAPALAVLHNGSVPVFADVDPKTFTIDAESIKKCITKKTKAVITVSLYGLSPDYDAILKVCRDHNIPLIEDNAECFLGKYKGKYVGEYGDFSSYSFQASKHMTSGEGGMLTTNNEQWADKVRKFTSLGYAGVSSKQGKISRLDIQDPAYSRHVTLGFNFRMSELQAACALGQLERLQELVDARINSAKIFDEVVLNSGILRRQEEPADYVNSYWAYACVLETANPAKDWYTFRDIFQKNGGDGYYAAWKLSYQEPLFQGEIAQMPGVWQKYQEGLCPNAEYLQKRMIQFKTDYWDASEAKKQAEILKKTIQEFKAL